MRGDPYVDKISDLVTLSARVIPFIVKALKEFGDDPGFLFKYRHNSEKKSQLRGQHFRLEGFQMVQAQVSWFPYRSAAAEK